jgi:hypothetical protein
MPVTPATQKAEVGGSQSEVSKSKSKRSYMKNEVKQKGLKMLLKCQSYCEALNSNPSTAKNQNNPEH